MTGVTETPATEKDSWLSSLLREHVGLLFTTVYILLITVGIIYEMWLFHRFRLNILYYADASDFLLVPFREPLVILVSVAPIPLFALYMSGVRMLGRRFPQLNARKKFRSQKTERIMEATLKAIAVILWSVVFSAEYAGRVHDQIVSGARKEVHVETDTNNPLTPRSIDGVLVGTTSRFLFLYERNGEQMRIIPTDKVSEIVTSTRKVPKAKSLPKPMPTPPSTGTQ
jgi:hypothetical protein